MGCNIITYLEPSPLVHFSTLGVLHSFLCLALLSGDLPVPAIKEFGNS